MVQPVWKDSSQQATLTVMACGPCCAGEDCVRGVVCYFHLAFSLLAVLLSQTWRVLLEGSQRQRGWHLPMHQVLPASAK